MGKTKQLEVKFNVELDEENVDEFKRTIDHKIDTLIDLESWPEIKRVWCGETKELSSIKYSDNYKNNHIKQNNNLDLNYDNDIPDVPVEFNTVSTNHNITMKRIGTKKITIRINIYPYYKTSSDLGAETFDKLYSAIFKKIRNELENTGIKLFDNSTVYRYGYTNTVYIYIPNTFSTLLIPTHNNVLSPFDADILGPIEKILKGIVSIDNDCNIKDNSEGDHCIHFIVEMHDCLVYKK